MKDTGKAKETLFSPKPAIDLVSDKSALVTAGGWWEMRSHSPVLPFNIVTKTAVAV